MAGQPPKLELWSAKLAAEAPGVDEVKPSVPTSWQYFCGALGYWLPHALNASASYRAGIRAVK